MKLPEPQTRTFSSLISEIEKRTNQNTSIPKGFCMDSSKIGWIN
ncbi:hypothetical protein [Candidatus Competibacter phosphatis]|nr:hypothetical protein [Candidatus Competibacter phosphatis]